LPLPDAGPWPDGESEAELRELVARMIGNCSTDRSYPECVFRPLTSLSHASLKNLLNGLSREAGLKMLQGECSCRNLVGGHNCQRR
jgi:hypothetical protein